MKKYSINIYHDDLEPKVLHMPIDPDNPKFLWIKPVDTHPNIALENACGKYVYDVLKNNYSFIFENQKEQDIN